MRNLMTLIRVYDEYSIYLVIFFCTVFCLRSINIIFGMISNNCVLAYLTET